MVDAETQRIRDEVIRAMAEQGEDVEALGLAVPEATEGEAESVAMPAWKNVVETAAETDALEDDAPRSNASLSAEEVERLFLEAVFNDVRAQSADGTLVSPSMWLEAGLVPEHFEADDWEMFVYEYLEERATEREEAAAAADAEPAAPIRTATRTVGVPRKLRAEEPQEEHEPEAANGPVGLEESEPVSVPAPEASGESEPACEPAAPASDALVCDDIAVLVGKHSYYLYSTDRMTDAYARWAFLASEDDRVLTFVECVRDESRKYPRPMEASSLTNAPFKLSPEEVDELWRTVRNSGAYPDLDTLTASNGDVYYFSTDYLTPTYAASLAEWNSVERDLFL